MKRKNLEHHMVIIITFLKLVDFPIHWMTACRVQPIQLGFEKLGSF